MYSEDGKTWKNVTGDKFSGNGWSVEYSPKQDLWVAVGSDSGGNNIMYSEDGKTWKNATGDIFSTTGDDVRSASSLFLPRIDQGVV